MSTQNISSAEPLPAASDEARPYILITKTVLTDACNPLRDAAVREGVFIVTTDAEIAAAFGIQPTGKDAVRKTLQRADEDCFVQRICLQVSASKSREIRFLSAKGKTPSSWRTIGALSIAGESLIKLREICPTDNDLGCRMYDLFIPMLRAVFNGNVFNAQGRTFSEGPFFSEFDVLNSILSNYRRFWQS